MVPRCEPPPRRSAGGEGGEGSVQSQSEKGWLHPRTSLGRPPLALASFPHKAEGAVFPVRGPAEEDERNFHIFNR